MKTGSIHTDYATNHFEELLSCFLPEPRELLSAKLSSYRPPKDSSSSTGRTIKSVDEQGQIHEDRLDGSNVDFQLDTFLNKCWSLIVTLSDEPIDTIGVNSLSSHHDPLLNLSKNGIVNSLPKHTLALLGGTWSRLQTCPLDIQCGIMDIVMRL